MRKKAKANSDNPIPRKRLEDATPEEVAKAMFRAADRKIKRPEPQPKPST